MGLLEAAVIGGNLFTQNSVMILYKCQSVILRTSIANVQQSNVIFVVVLKHALQVDVKAKRNHNAL